MNRSRICFIGAGFHASTNIFPSAIEAGAEIIGIATRSMDRSKAALLRFGSNGRPYDDYKTMLLPIYMKLNELIMNETLGAARSFEARFAVDKEIFICAALLVEWRITG